MKKLSTILVLLIFQNLSYAQDWLLGSSSNFTNEAFDVQKDNQGNSIVTGYFSGETNFQGTILQSQNGYSDIYIVKINSTGNVVWAKSFGGPQADRGLKLAIDAQNNIYVTGYFAGTMNIGTSVLSSTANSRDFFIAKLNSAGDAIWARSEGGNQGETAYDIAVDGHNNCIVTGQFEGTTSIGGSTFVSQWNPITNTASFDFFVAKYNSSGTPIWVKNGHSQYEDRGLSLTCDASDNIYVTGQFSENFVFLGQTISNQIYNAGFVSKISPAGNLVWFRKLAAAQTLVYDITLNALEEIYITGDFLGTLTYFGNTGQNQISNPYSKKIFAIKISNSGTYIWGKAQGSDSEVSSRAVLIDAAQNMYIGGYFRCNFDQYRDSTSTGLWNSAGFRDIFVTKFSPSGNMLWNKHAGGKKDDMCYALAQGNNDEPIFAGSFTNHINIPTTYSYLSNYAINGSVDYEYEVYPFYEIQGDESKNSFVGKVIKSNTLPLFYYQTTYYDSIAPDLIPSLDTIEACAPFDLTFDTKTSSRLGPGYNVLWNNGSQNNVNPVTMAQGAGMVSLELERWDGCSTFHDSIYVIPRPAPSLPYLTDDHAYNDTNIYPYNIIKLCYPDTAEVWYTNVCANCVVTTTGPNGSYSYTGTGPFPVWQNGDHFLTITNEWGCQKTNHFTVQVLYLTAPDTMDLDLVFYDPADWNDSITVCQGININLVATDLYTNPAGNYSPYNHVFADEQFTPLNFGSILIPSPHRGTFTPTFTGWHKIRYDAWLGTVNICGVDTTHFYVIDSVFVTVIPNPAIITPILTSDGPICPGEFITLSSSAVYTTFSWAGSTITWMSADGDSIQLTQPGLYIYHAEVTDSVTGCSNSTSASINVTEKAPPLILMQPADGIVCPYDSVYLQITQAGGYDWFGPEGYSLGIGSSIYASDQGFYHCIYTDVEGCEMTTPQVEIKEYSTPYLQATPGTNLCVASHILISAVYEGNATFQWHAPLNSTSSSVTVSSPGTYYCSITQCGITVIDSVVVTHTTFLASITATDTMLCFGQQITLSTPGGMSQYEWNDGQGSSSITVSQAGDYFVTVTNADGCTAISETIHVGFHNNSVPPAISDIAVCLGSDATITNNSPYTTFWFADSTSLLPDHVGNSIQIQQVYSDTVIYATYQNTFCPTIFTSVHISVIQPLTEPAIIGSTILCSGMNLELTSDTIANVHYSWTYNGIEISNQVSCSMQESDFVLGELIHLTIHDDCSADSNSIRLNLIPKDTLQLNVDSMIICADTSYTFFPMSIFAGEIHWQNGTNIYIQDTLTLTISEITNPLLIAYSINDQGCNSVNDTITFSISALTFVDINSVGFFCVGSAMVLEGLSENSNLTWTTPAGDSISQSNFTIPVLNSTTDGWYFLTAEDAVYGCTLYDSIYINPSPLPFFDIHDTILCSDNSVSFDAPIHAGWDFVWFQDETLPTYTPDSSCVLLLTATNLHGCTYTDSIAVTFVDCTAEAVNVITANGDGINDYFVIPNAELMFGNYFIIFNRWGNIIYEETDYRNKFNGSDVSAGVYFYQFFPKGKSNAGGFIQGFFHVIR